MEPGASVRGRLLWHGEARDVVGVLESGFLLARGRVLVRLGRVTPPLPGEDRSDVWVEADTLAPLEVADGAGAPPPAFLLRSAMHELPGDHTRDYAMRALSVALSRFVADRGTALWLAPGVADTMEFTVVVDVPTDEPADGGADGEEGILGPGPDYLWKFQTATRPGHARSVRWTPPPPPFAAASLVPKRGPGARDGADRSRAAHYIGQLPLWLTARRFWSVFRWRDDRLEHLVQFSLPNKLRRTVVRRFRLQTT